MSGLKHLQDRIEDHARRMREARRRYRDDLAALRRWPGFDLERAAWFMAAQQRFRTEARALADEAAELRALSRACGANAPTVDDNSVLALAEELTGFRPSTMPTTMSVTGGLNHGRVTATPSPNPSLHAPVDRKLWGPANAVYVED